MRKAFKVFLEKSILYTISTWTQKEYRNKRFLNLNVGGLTAEYKKAKKWADWNDIVKNSNGYDILVMPTFHAVKDETGQNISIDDIVEWPPANSSMPVFSNLDRFVIKLPADIRKRAIFQLMLY